MELLANYHKSRKNRFPSIVMLNLIIQYDRCLIFVLYKREASSLQSTLMNRGYNVTAIHGDMNQYDRTAALEEFKSGRIPLLIATDVAARGLDIPQVEVRIISCLLSLSFFPVCPQLLFSTNCGGLCSSYW